MGVLHDHFASPPPLATEAKRLRIPPDQLEQLLQHLELPANVPLTPAAEEQVLTTWRVQRMGRERAVAERRARLVALTPDDVAAVAALLDGVDAPDALPYLLAALPLVGIHPFRTWCPTLLRQLAELISHPVPPDPLVWGALIRLPDLPPPSTDPLDWCQYRLHTKYHDRCQRTLAEALSGQLSAAQACTVLGLPAGVELTPAAINATYRVAARRAHPDGGGTPQDFAQVVAARARLLAWVATQRPKCLVVENDVSRRRAQQSIRLITKENAGSERGTFRCRHQHSNLIMTDLVFSGPPLGLHWADVTRSCA